MSHDPKPYPYYYLLSMSNPNTRYVFYHYMSHDLCYDWLAAALRSGEVGAVLNPNPTPDPNPNPNPDPDPDPDPNLNPNQVGAVLIVSRFENLSTQADLASRKSSVTSRSL